MSDEKINNIRITMAETQRDISYTKEKVQSIDNKLNHFIKTADDKYARCEDLNKQNKKLDEQDAKLDNMNKFLNKVLLTAVLALLGFIATLFKDVIMSNFII